MTILVQTKNLHTKIVTCKSYTIDFNTFINLVVNMVSLAGGEILEKTDDKIVYTLRDNKSTAVIADTVSQKKSNYISETYYYKEEKICVSEFYSKENITFWGNIKEL